MSHPAAARVRLFSRVLLLCLAVLLIAPVGAQPLVPISIGDSVQGTLTASEPSLRYAFQLQEPQSITVRIFSIGGGLIPSMRLLGPTGIILASAPNLASENQLTVDASVGRGIHQIIIEGVNGTSGQFLLLLESGTLTEPPTPLPESQFVSASVDATASTQRYGFAAAAAEETLLFVESDLPLSGPVITLKDAATGDTLGMLSTRLTGVRFTIPAGTTDYLLEIAASGTGSEPFTVCRARVSQAGACGQTAPETAIIPSRTPQTIVISTQVPPTQLPTTVPTSTLAPLPPSAVCIAGSLTGNLVNVRAAPTTASTIVTTLSGLNVANVIGRLPDTSWYQVSANGQTGWMAAQVVRLGGPCQNITVMPPTPTPAPTLVLLPPTNTPSALVQLNVNGAPTYGSVNLVSGFTPDPHNVAVTSGGQVDVSYLGGNCVGFAATNPDFRVNYSGGPAQLLRFYFVGSVDTTMVVRKPDGSFLCGDDSYNTANPTVNVDFLANGTYSIWVANYVLNNGGTGTLSITEVDNHP